MVVGYRINVTKPLTVEICVSEVLTLVCTKDIVVVMKLQMVLEVLQAHSQPLGLVTQIIIVQAI
jgi:hypothetical protein